MNVSPRRQPCEPSGKWANQRVEERATSTRWRPRFFCSKRSMFRSEICAAVVAAAFTLTACGGTPQGAATRVIIPRGATFSQATDSLAKADLIGWPKLFKLYGRVTGGDR